MRNQLLKLASRLEYGDDTGTKRKAVLKSAGLPQSRSDDLHTANMTRVVAQSKFEPQAGELRIVTGTITEYAPEREGADEFGNVEYLGLLVEEYEVYLDSNCYEVEHWRCLFPLVDAPIHGIVSRLPAITVLK